MTLEELLDTEIVINIPDDDYSPHYYRVYINTDMTDKNIIYLELDGDM